MMVMPRKKLLRNNALPHHVTARTNNSEKFHVATSQLWKSFEEECGSIPRGAYPRRGLGPALQRVCDLRVDPPDKATTMTVAVLGTGVATAVAQKLRQNLLKRLSPAALDLGRVICAAVGTDLTIIEESDLII